MEWKTGQRTAAGLDGVTALPDHGADGAAQHVCIMLANARI